ncbi:MAG: virulence-associated E family protein, partial [Alphaproteobacteria bacterium]
YGLDTLPAKGCPVLLVEGESDAQTLWHHGFDAVAVPGAGSYAPGRDDSELDGLDIIAFIEPDQGGEALIKQLNKSRHTSRIKLAKLDGFKDVSELHCKTPDRFDDIVKAAIAAAQPLKKTTEKPVKYASSTEDGGIDWIQLTEKGGVKGRSQKNIRQFIDHVGLSLSYDEMTYRFFLTRNGVTKWISDEVGNDLWLEADELGLPSQKEFFLSVIERIARQNPLHPIRDYLGSLRWDGVPRLDKWLHDYLGAKDTELNTAFGRKHLIAAVRRVRQPGCKYDTMLVLQGRQGRGKSSTVCALCPEEDYFTDNLTLGADQKQIIEITTGKWLVEQAELDGMGKKDASTIKAMISRRIDGARLAYGRSGTERRRQFVLFGTVNDLHFLRDQTGNRRFWPVTVGHPANYDPDEAKALIENNRDQLWAEAAHYEAQGESLVLPKTLWAVAAEAQGEHLVIDPWQERIETLLDTGENEFADDIIPTDTVYGALGVSTEKRNPVITQRIANIMANAGFERARLRIGEGGCRKYVFRRME